MVIDFYFTFWFHCNEWHYSVDIIDDTKLFPGFPLHSAPQSTTSSTINVDFDAVFGGKSTAPEYRATNGKN